MTQTELQDRILFLETKKKEDFKALKEQLHYIHESLRPVNLIRSAFHQVTESPDIKEDFVNSTIGMATGFVTNKLFMQNSRNPIKRVLGSILQMGVTNLVAKNPGPLKEVGEKIAHFIFKKRPEKEPEEESEKE